MEIIRLTDIPSTNDYLLGLKTDREVVAVTDYQSHGKGMGTNRWESEPGKNLLFSILIHPVWLPIRLQYLLSMTEAVTIAEVLREELTQCPEAQQPLTIKWPNDIYYGDRKISGTRIDVNLKGARLQDVIIGTGININQQSFLSDAPNPISLRQITGRDHDRESLLNRMIERFEQYLCLLRQGVEEGRQSCGEGHQSTEEGTKSNIEQIVNLYHQHLYRREGLHPYRDENGDFLAATEYVEPTGILHLRRQDGTPSTYMFKEVTFI